MEVSKSIEAIGRNGNPIKVGDTVKYVNSDTISLVADIKKNETGMWVLLEATNLWYRDETLELTEAELKEKKEERELTSEELEERLQKHLETIKGFDVGKAGGGGAGG